MSQELVERFRRDDLTFGVIGLGYVGLPLAVEAARSGMKVLGFDVQGRVTKGINDGLSHIQDLTHEEIRDQVEAGRLEATTDMGRLGECGAISICVPTPLSKTRDPDISF
ncbi:MAG: UDP-N-acetyl-D-glucosamine dehydrogenase, partial [Longimicrobiales bacterium]|nr:UDP-N-acetyl-D-glucosamine dehydrogenase [Longimicrobiales bacterium]